MDRLFKRSSNGAADVKEENDLLRQKVKTVEEAASTLEVQLTEEKRRYEALEGKTDSWKEKVKAMTAADRERIAQLEAQLSAYDEVQGSTSEPISESIAAAIQAALGGVRQEYQKKVETYRAQESILKESLWQRDVRLNEVQAELDKLKVIHLNAEQAYHEDIRKLEQQLSDETDGTHAHLLEQQELGILRERMDKQKEEVCSLEEHSAQQREIIEQLQQELTTLTQSENNLSQQLLESRRALEDVQQNQARWKQKVVEMKRNDDEVIKKLHHDIQLLRGSSTTTVGTEEQPSTPNTPSKKMSTSNTPPNTPTQTEHQDSIPKNGLDNLLQEKALLGEQLQAALRDGEEASAELQRLREELAGSSNASHQQLEAVLQEKALLGEQLQAALRDGEEASAELQRLREEQKRALDDLTAVSERFANWQQKVKDSKLADGEKIAELQGVVEECKVASMLTEESLGALVAITQGSEAAESVCGRDECFRTVTDVVMFVQGILVESAELLSVGNEIFGGLRALAKTVLEGVRNCIITQEELRKEVAGLKEQCSELSKEVERYRQQQGSDEVLREANSQLEERCELLRKEIKRQRESYQRERAQQQCEPISAVTPVLETAAPASRVSDPASMDAALRVAAGGVFEKDMVALAATQSQRDSELRLVNKKMIHLEKENEELKRTVDYNNGIIAQYTREIESLRANEKVQLSMEYVRNIIHQFLCSSVSLRPQMIPAITTVLEFSEKEKQDVRLANPGCPSFH